MTKIIARTVIALGLASCAGSAMAQGGAEGGGPPVLAKQLVPAPGAIRLMVTSDAFTSGATLDDKYTQNGDNMSPSLSWSKGPQVPICRRAGSTALRRSSAQPEIR